MPRQAILLLGSLFCCAAMTAQVTAPEGTAAAAKSETRKAISPAAELELDAAKRWTQAALADDSHLSPIERDLLLIRLADIWKEVDRPRALEYLKDGLDHLKPDADPDASPGNIANYSSVIESVSSEVRGLDRKAWDNLMEDLPKWAVSDTIARQANDLAIDGDVASAMELEAKSLQRGGSDSDVHTLESIIDTDPGTAAKLFDQLLNTAMKPDSDPNLLLMLAQDAFPNSESTEAETFFNQERQQRLLDSLAQVTLSGEDTACNYYFAVMQAMSHFPPSLQGQLLSIETHCNQKGSRIAFGVAEPQTTDDLVRAMKEASTAQSRLGFRERAFRRASEVDHDYLQAVQLCLGLSQSEREQLRGSSDRFERWAVQSASSGVRAALQKHDDAEVHNLLDILPPAMRAEVELKAARSLSKSDKPRALLMLADARRIIEGDATIHLDEDAYKLLLIETAELSPADVTTTWRTLITGLNQFQQAKRMQTQAVAVRLGGSQNGSRAPSFLYPWPVPPGAIADESFVRASIEDLDSVEFREELRAGTVSAFLSRYTEAMKDRAPTSATRVANAKN